MKTKLKLINSKTYTKEELETMYVFNDILNEERGISKEVQNAVSGINNDLYDYYQSSIEPNINYDTNLYYNTIDEFDISLFNKKYTLRINWLFYKDKKIYNKYRNAENELYYFNNNEKLIEISIIIINKNIVLNTFTTKLAHEIKHSFQCQKFNIEQNKLLQKDSYYKKRNIKPNNIAEEHFKTIIYLSSQREQEAYAEELYRELCEIKPLHYYEVINHCNSYLIYKKLEKSIKYFEENKNNFDVQNIIKQYNYKLNSFIKKAKINCNNFLHRLGKAISLYEEEKYALKHIYEYD